MSADRRSGAGRATFSFLRDLPDGQLETLARGTIDDYVDVHRVARARARKAAILADYCRSHGIDADTADRLDQTGRDAIAGLTDQRTPSPATWAVVVALLRLPGASDREEVTP